MTPLLRKLSGIILIPAIFMVIGWRLYAPAIHAPFVFDDIDNITANPHIRLTAINTDQIAQITAGPSATRPVAMLTIAGNYYVHQYRPAGYHVINILIHIITALLVFQLTGQTLRLCRAGPVLPASLLAALVWLAHPLHTQSVTYVIQRMNSMAAMFYLLALLCYITARMIPADDAGAPIKKGLLFATVILAGVLGLGSKPTVATLPVMLLAYEWFFFQDLSTAWLKKNLARPAIFLIVFLAIACLYLGGSPIDTVYATYATQDFSLGQRLLTEPLVIVYYLSLLVFPHPSRLNLDYNFPLSRALYTPPGTVLGLIIIFVLLATIIHTARKHRLIAFAILWFLATLVIESSFIGLAIIFEHRTYLPSVFPVIGLVWLVFSHVRPKPLAVAVLCVAIGVCGIWTYQRNRIWAEPILFWQDCSAKSPYSPRILNNLGMAYKEANQIETASLAFQKALRHDPESITALNNLGTIMLNKGMTGKALSFFEQAIMIEPDYYDAHYNRGLTLMNTGRVIQAAEAFQKTLRLNPFYEKAHNNLGATLLSRLDPDRAIVHFQRTLELDPYYAKAYSNMGIAYFKKGLTDRAVECFSQALDIDPFYLEAYNNMRRVKSQAEKFREPIARLAQGLGRNPNNPGLYFRLGETYQQAGMHHLALEQYEKALSLKPDAIGCLNSLGNLFAAHYQYRRAADMFEKLAVLLPEAPVIHYNLACLYAQQNQTDKAVAALETAIKNGYANWDQIAVDNDLENIRHTKFFKKIIADHGEKNKTR